MIVPGSIGALWPDTSLAMIVVSLACYAGLLMLTSVRRAAEDKPATGPDLAAGR